MLMKLPSEAAVQLETMNTAIAELRTLRQNILTELVTEHRQYQPGFAFHDSGKDYEVGEATIVRGEVCYWCNCLNPEANEEGAPYLESTIDQLLGRATSAHTG